MAVIAALVAFTGFTLAWTSVASASALDSLQKFASQTRSAQGNFTQHVVSRNNKVTDSSGDFQFARPGKFRWTYSKPYEQVLVADGEKFTMYDKDLNQVTVRKLNDALGSTPAAILFGDNALDKSFELKEAPTRDGVEWLDATPKTHDTTFSRISIGFRNGELAAMELHDALGQVTQLTFLNVQRNPNLPADNFRFVVPKGADVLQN